MKPLPANAFYLAAAITFGPMQPAHAQCALHMLAPSGSSIHVGTRTITLGEADSVPHPTAWQGPLHTGRCSFDIGIIEQPIALTPNNGLYVATYSGSTRKITLYDLETCRTRWESGEFAGKLKLTAEALQMGKRTFKLDAQCVPAERTNHR